MSQIFSVSQSSLMRMIKRIMYIPMLLALQRTMMENMTLVWAILNQIMMKMTVKE